MRKPTPASCPTGTSPRRKFRCDGHATKPPDSRAKTRTRPYGRAVGFAVSDGAGSWLSAQSPTVALRPERPALWVEPDLAPANLMGSLSPVASAVTLGALVYRGFG
jgi:hypothetical protein